ncbi:acylphosphatase [Roseococcus sp. SDR]|uniref:acylphosphatase n=1 Tax=Roseococcus sp. SDR TaxID=2835532 RepID=UPI001BCDD3CD|nr:acylphosphatase [Roseococcus sp. SDR]MBS7789125.1 acylphosphatase [Roseococcus sp. SDR]MBV1844439.1 acylphosphatase [Roseococcus sp. SDR]
MKARLLRIAGRVQGVGYRDWLLREARRHGISGWVRNRADGTVEALLAGEEDGLNAVLTACRRGPPLAQVTAIEESFAEPPEEPGFHRRPSL